jgi:hypothetical protein
MLNIFFSNISSKIFPFYFVFVLQIWSYEFLGLQFSLYRIFVFEYIYTIGMNYFGAYIIFYLNKLYNFRFSLNNYDLDLTWYD